MFAKVQWELGLGLYHSFPGIGWRVVGSICWSTGVLAVDVRSTLLDDCCCDALCTVVLSDSGLLLSTMSVEMPELPILVTGNILRGLLRRVRRNQHLVV